MLDHLRAMSKKPNVAGTQAPTWPIRSGGRLMVFQNPRSASTRSSGALPAMIAVFKAPIEMPDTQVGWIPAWARPS